MSRQDPVLTRFLSDCRRFTINKKTNKRHVYSSEIKQAKVIECDEVFVDKRINKSGQGSFLQREL